MQGNYCKFDKMKALFSQDETGSETHPTGNKELLMYFHKKINLFLLLDYFYF